MAFTRRFLLTALALTLFAPPTAGALASDDGRQLLREWMSEQSWAPLHEPPKAWQGHPFGDLLTIRMVAEQEKTIGSRAKIYPVYRIKEINGQVVDCTMHTYGRSQVYFPIDWRQMPNRENDDYTIWPTGTQLFVRGFAVAQFERSDYDGTPGERGNGGEQCPFVGFIENLVVTEILSPDTAGIRTVQQWPLDSFRSFKSVVPAAEGMLRMRKPAHVRAGLAILGSVGMEVSQATDALVAIASDTNQEIDFRYRAMVMLQSVDRLPDALIPTAAQWARADKPAHQQRGLFLAGMIGPKAKDAIPPCIEVLAARRTQVAFKGLRDDEQVGDSRLNSGLDDTTSILPELAAWSLGRSGAANKQVVIALIRGTADESRPVRMRCLESLRKLSLSAGDANVMEAISSPNKYLARSVIVGLGSTKDPSQQAANLKVLTSLIDASIHDRMQEAAFVAIRKMGRAAGPAAPQLIEAFEQRSKTRTKNSIRDDSDSYVPGRETENIPAFWGNANSMCRAAILKALGAMDDERALPVLERALCDPADAETAFRALGPERAVAALKRKLQGTSKEIQRQAAKSIVPDPVGLSRRARQCKELVPFLTPLLDDTDSRPAALTALAAINDPASIPALERYPQDPAVVRVLETLRQSSTTPAYCPCSSSDFWQSADENWYDTTLAR